MFKSAKPVKVQKHSGLLHLPALALEDLPKLNHLMHDTRESYFQPENFSNASLLGSEFSRNIRTYNLSVTCNMNRSLSQAHRDVLATVEGLNRSQQETYKVMCKINELQKKKARETYKRYQEVLRDKQSKGLPHTKSSGIMPVHGTKLPSIQKGKALTPEPIEKASNKDGRQTEPSVREDKDEQATSDSTDNPALGPVINMQSITVEIDSRTDSSPTNCVEDANRPMLSPYKSSEDDSKQEGSDEMLEPSNENDSQVAEHREKVVELPKLSLPSRTAQRKAFFTASLKPTLPAITESDAPKTKESTRLPADDKLKRVPKCSQKQKKEEGMEEELIEPVLPWRGRSTNTVTKSGDEESVDGTVASAMKAQSLRSRIASLERQHMKEFLKKQNLETKPKPYQLELREEGKPLNSDRLERSVSRSTSQGQQTLTSLPESNGKRSIAKERRRLAKLRAMHRKAVIESENIYVFTQSSDGTFQPGANTYKKRRFLPPSNREEYERQKILKSVSHHMENHEEKIGQFFKKLDIPIQTKLPKPAPAPTSPEVPFSQPIKKEKSIIKPLSETAKTVAYIRQYIRPSDRTDDIPRITSWNQNS